MLKFLASAAVGAVVVLGAGAAGAQGLAIVASDLPPNAVPGHCYGKLLVPEQYETYSENVIDTAQHTDLRVVPAVYGEDVQQVIATEARVEYETIPATYKTITETITVRPATVRKVTVPAVYAEETEQVLVSEAHTVWKRGARSPSDIVVPGTSKILPTGEVICLVQVPAEYRTVTRKVIRQAETTRDIIEPAVTTTITRQVIERAARVVEHQIPATYKTIRITKLITAEHVEQIVIPATYKTVTKQRLITAGHFEWKDVACRPEADNAPPVRLGSSERTIERSRIIETAPVVHSSTSVTTTTREYHSSSETTTLARGGDYRTLALQEALKKRGYYAGPLSGRFTSALQLSMVRFQRDNGLAKGSFDHETAAALGMTPGASEHGIPVGS